MVGDASEAAWTNGPDAGDETNSGKLMSGRSDSGLMEVSGSFDVNLEEVAGPLDSDAEETGLLGAEAGRKI